ncbi:formate dehydrogenase accessory protein FdhE [Geobacter sp. AOG1]|uniref:formate dehydrogenase accessory protein FdhE n=1 Tax=Geobacter sp. AOG1 TaxID=1566346 RepID=UPI001CC745EC|nr:formate dehydrogenase accessory protein FdhE [Geobacter sp. AOG1]GFE56278.1 protein FdhE [Geobacter sp. AOG1]
MTTDVRMIEPGQIEAPAGQFRFLFLPGRDLFARRAARFRFLANGHSLGDYLFFLALLADAQQEALNRFPTISLPDPEEEALCREHGMPLLGCRSLRRNPAWREGLTTILQRMGEANLPVAAQETVASLMHADETEVEEMADRILAGDMDGISPRQLPFVAAALQVYWAQMVSALGDGVCGRLEQGGLCPVCGSHPVAGIVRTGGKEQGLRYLCCSLCASQWHMVRIKCSSCESTHGINHYSLEGSNGAVKAESCDDCNSYLKLLYLEKDREMEALADDLATLPLDMLMDQEGKVRRGPNLLFHPGRV